MSIVLFPAPVAQPLPSSQPPSDDGVLREILNRVRSLDPLTHLMPRRFEDAALEFITVHGATLRSVETVKGRFVGLRRYFAGKMVHEITTAMVQDMIADRMQSGAKPATVMRDRSQLSKFINWCIEREHAVFNPVNRTKPIRQDNGRIRWLTVEEVDRLLHEAGRTRGGLLAPLIFAALHTGARRGELLKLEWRFVDLQTGTITFVAETTKSRRTRIVPMVPELVEVLRDLRATQRAIYGDCVHVFTYNGRTVESNKTAFEIACRRAGIVDFRWHDLRHCFASFFMQSGGDLYRLQMLLGHTTPAMTQRYAHLSAKHLMESRAHIGIPGRIGRTAPVTIVQTAGRAMLPVTIPAETLDLLRDLRPMFDKRQFIPTREILEELSKMPRWSILKGPIMSTCRVLAGMLRPICGKASQVGQWHGPNTKGYTLAKLAPAFARYLEGGRG